MIRLQESRDCFVKCLLFVLLLGFISLGSIGGCGNNGEEQDGTQALTENDFANDPSLRADPEGGVIVKFLEPPNSEENENDTGGVGIDTIPYKYTKTLSNTFCWEDEDGDAGHFMELDDSDGNEILRIDVNGECVTVVIEAGDYVMTIHHDGRIEITHPVFIIPNPENNQQARETDGLINRFKVVVSNIVKGIQNTVSKDAKAQMPPALDTLINTGKCIGCDLTSADLSFQKLEGVDLINATLTRAILIGTFLTGADFSNATWIDGVCTCQDNSIGQCVGCTFAIIPQKILDLRPIRGMAYQPAPSDYSPGCGRGDFNPASCKYFDTDFANNDFKGLWSSDNPGGTGPGRGDLEIMANELNINFLHLYNWSSPPFRNHIDFLNECSQLGLRVALPISNFTLGCIQSQACGDFDPKQNIKDILTEVITNGVPHEAIAMWLIGNEYDLSTSFSVDVVATAIQFLIEAEQELGVVADANKLPISSPVSFGTFGAPPDQPGIKKTKELIDAIRKNPTTAPALVTRFVAALNPFNKANFMQTYLEMTFPEKFPNVALWLSEYGFNSIDAGGEAQQAQIVKEQLELCESLISNPTPMTNPNNYFLGCTNFEWSNEDWKGGAEAAFGAVKFDGTQGNGVTVGIPTNGPENYPIDKIVNKPVFDSIMGAFMK